MLLVVCNSFTPCLYTYYAIFLCELLFSLAGSFMNVPSGEALPNSWEIDMSSSAGKLDFPSSSCMMLLLMRTWGPPLLGLALMDLFSQPYLVQVHPLPLSLDSTESSSLLSLTPSSLPLSFLVFPFFGLAFLKYCKQGCWSALLVTLVLTGVMYNARPLSALI